jgi:hypothetical protein
MITKMVVTLQRQRGKEEEEKTLLQKESSARWKSAHTLAGSMQLDK